MSEVNVIIDGRNYAIQCDAGQEQRVIDLGKYVDARMRDVKGNGGTAQNSQLMVLTSLVLADEIYELRAQMAQLQQQAPAPAPAERETPKPIVYQGLEPRQERELADKITKLASRVDTLTKRDKKN
jgi:cell division protein ZapA